MTYAVKTTEPKLLVLIFGSANYAHAAQKAPHALIYVSARALLVKLQIIACRAFLTLLGQAYHCASSVLVAINVGDLLCLTKQC